VVTVEKDGSVAHGSKKKSGKGGGEKFYKGNGLFVLYNSEFFFSFFVKRKKNVHKISKAKCTGAF
jgi:hypothetical protein